MNQEEGKPTMLNAEQVAQRLNMSKGFACKIIQEMNEEQIKKGRAVVKGRVRSDHFEADYFTAFATPFQTSLLQCSTVG